MTASQIQRPLFGDMNLPPAAPLTVPTAPAAPKPAPAAPNSVQSLLLPVPAAVQTTETVAPVQLYAYQQDVLNRALRAVAAGKRRVVVHMPTGAGKTMLMARLVQRMIAAGKTVLMAAHRTELVSQMVATLKKLGLTEEQIGIIDADHEMDPGQQKPVYVASKDSLIRWIPRKHGEKTCDMKKFSLVLIDEAHRSAARTYGDLFGNTTVLGLTATPIRNGGRGLGDLYDTFILGPSVAQLIRLGRLVQPKYYVATQIISAAVLEAAEQADDYDQGVVSADIEARKLTVYGDVVAAYHQYADGQQAMLFAPSVATSEGFVQMFAAAGVISRHIDGNTPKAERESIVADFRAGTVRLISSVDIFTEGFDCPGAGCIILCRPTKSRIFHLQSIGRGLRAADGKTAAIILDHVGNVSRLGPVEAPQPWEAAGWELAKGTIGEDKAAAARKRKVRAKRCLCSDCGAEVDVPITRRVDITGLGWRRVLIGQTEIDGHRIPLGACPAGHPVAGDPIAWDCPECSHHHSHTDGLNTCINCGYIDARAAIAALTNTVDAEIRELDPKTLTVQYGGEKSDRLDPRAEMARWWSGLQQYSIGLGEDPKRAWGRFCGRWGMTPQQAGVKAVQPGAVDPDVDAWIVSQKIAWRSRKREEAKQAAESVAVN